MSIDAKMAWRNVWRNRRRTVLTLCAIAFACMLLVFMLSFQLGSYDTMINTSVRIQTGHIKVRAKGYGEKNNIRYVVENPRTVGRIITNTPGVAAHTDRAHAFSLVSYKDRTYAAMITGVDPVREIRVSTMETLVSRGEYLSEGDTESAVIGRLLAKNLQVDLGDEISLLGQGRDGSIAAAVLRVKGIFSSGIDELDRRMVQMPLGVFQEIFFMRGAVHEIVVIVDSLSRVSRIETELAEKLADQKNKRPPAVETWRELMPGLVQAIRMDLFSGLIIYLFLVIVVAFSIMNTFLMAIFERTREFGVLTAMGMTKNRLTKLLMTESMIMTVIGVAVGTAAGIAITLILGVVGMDFGGGEIMRQYGISGKLYPRLTPVSVTVGPVAVLAVTFPAALYPALKIRRLKPVEALAYV